MQNREITVEKLNQIADKMRFGNDRYALDELDENGFFVRTFRKYPNNSETEIVAMKVALVDTVYSTNLGRILGNKKYKQSGKVITREVFTFKDLVEKIAESDFDNRVRQGDISLVSELSEWSKAYGANIMSFFSKYCTCHNYISYGNDDYSIFDAVVKNNLGKYISEAEFSYLFPKHKLKAPDAKDRQSDIIAKAVALEIERMKNACDYKSFHELIGRIFKLKHIPSMRRNLDYLIWYDNRLDF